MIDGNLLVENLIGYSKEYLHLSEYDVDYLRVRLYKFFSLDYGAAKKFAGRGKVLSKEVLISNLREYIAEVFNFNGDIEELISEIFGQLIPLPSQIDRNFKSFRERMGSHAAFDYFHSVSCAGNYVEPEDFSPLFHELGKTAKIYVSSADREGKDYLSDELRNAENFRAITYEAEENEYKFAFLKYVDCAAQAELFPSDRKSFLLDHGAIEDALSFLEYLPQLCIISSVSGKTNENLATSDRFYLIGEDLPIFEAGDLAPVSSSAYPDADLFIVDYPVATVRFFTFNRNTVSELTNDIISGWNTYADEENGIHGNSKKAGNRAFFSIKILNDGRYMVHISFTKTDDFNLYAEKKGVDELFSSRYYPLTLSGRFVIDKRAKETFDNAVKFVRKQSSDKSAAKPFEKLLSKIETENLFVSNAQKAQTLVSQELYDAAENFLLSQSAFIDEERWLLTFRKFLSTVGIK